MNHYRTKLLLASLVFSAVFTAGTANATDDRMWREQVAPPSDSVIKLEWKTVDPTKKLGNDSLPWREQVKLSGKNRVFLTEHAQRTAKSSDWRLWREQIKSVSSRYKQSVASNFRQTNKTQNQ